MALNTVSKLPEWLDEEAIEMLKHDMETYDETYTEDDEKRIPFDSNYDVARSRAYNAKRILSEYGLI